MWLAMGGGNDVCIDPYKIMAGYIGDELTIGVLRLSWLRSRSRQEVVPYDEHSGVWAGQSRCVTTSEGWRASPPRHPIQIREAGVDLIFSFQLV